jgi:tetratricopeptide (TPR) repeat protein
MQLEGKELQFRNPKNRANPFRVMILLVLIVALIAVLRSYAKGDIQPFFLPTATPTRTTNSYLMEANTHFLAGNLDKSIVGYKKASELDPSDVSILVKLAQVQVYSSNSLTTDAERVTRLTEALETINKAKELAPQDSTVLAVRAFVLNWNSNPVLAGERSEALLNEAEAEATLALQLDNTNTLALAYYAEILVDQFKWVQARQYIQQAMESDASLMDVHRIQAYTYEILGEYNLAIQEYQKAIEITPNLTFLYISVGKIYRHLELYEQALEYFDKAANLNEQLGIKDPIPYMAIANTYIRLGEPMVASRNAFKALTYNPYSPDVYGQVGLIYHRSRNYEGAIPALKCAIEGCTAEETCEVRDCDPTVDEAIVIEGMPLSDNTVVYYYTYGSVLSGLHRPGDDKCEQAIVVFARIREKYAEDDAIMRIVNAGESICISTN